MADRLIFQIADDGSLSLEGQAIKANNVDTVIVANASEKAGWEVVHRALQLLMRFDRTTQGFVGTGQ